MFEQFLAVFFAVGLAEFGDKTQLAALALSAKYKDRLQVIAGASLAFFLATALAVALGGFLGSTLNPAAVKTASAVVFIAFGAYSLFSKDEGGKAKIKDSKGAFFSSLALIFIMEIGDKTNLANFFFASIYNPFLVLAAALCAEVLLTVIAVYFGGLISRKISHSTTKKVSALLFILIGLATLLL